MVFVHEVRAAGKEVSYLNKPMSDANGDLLDVSIEYVGSVEEVTHGWTSYTYDVSWGDKHD